MQKRDFCSMWQIYSREADRTFCSQEVRNPKFYYRALKSPPLLLTLNNLNSFHVLPLYFCKTNFWSCLILYNRVLGRVLFVSGLKTEHLRQFLSYPIRVTCPVCLFHFHVSILITFGETTNHVLIFCGSYYLTFMHRASYI